MGLPVTDPRPGEQLFGDRPILVFGFRNFVYNLPNDPRIKRPSQAKNNNDNIEIIMEVNKGNFSFFLESKSPATNPKITSPQKMMLLNKMVILPPL